MVRKETYFFMAKSISRIMLAFFFVWSGAHLDSISGTNSLFVDSALVQKNEFSAAHWIPEIEAIISPEFPDGEDGFYKTTPCVSLAYSGLSSGTATIWYEFSNDGDPVSGGTAYSGSCVSIPDGDPTYFQAVAVNNENVEWKSEIVSKTFKVDTKKCSNERNKKHSCKDKKDDDDDHRSDKHKENSHEEEDHGDKHPDFDKNKEKEQESQDRWDVKLNPAQDNESKIPCVADSVKSEDVPEPLEGEVKMINKDDPPQLIEEKLTGEIVGAEQKKESISEDVQVLGGASNEVVK